LSEIRFYHLQRARLEDVLPVMLERAWGRGDRVLVRAGSRERVEALNAHLWTYRADGFLPHGGPGDGEGERQPIYLTDEAENPNRAKILMLCDGAEAPPLVDFTLVCELFDGSDETAIDASRRRWRAYKAQGHALVYYQQNERGGWEEKQRA
jgi:DNA polymerase III subunit chi